MALILNNLRIYQNNNPLITLRHMYIDAGQIFTLMGPSGCGKSTLLAWLSGFLPQGMHAQGRALLYGCDITQYAPEKRAIGTLFQEDRLFPHLTVLENLQFALPTHYKGKQRVNKCIETLRAVDLEHKAYRYPQTLSGGQKARVNLLRSLLAEPKAILLDEPFGQLDAQIRQKTRQWAFGEIKKRNLPCILVTHDTADIDCTKALLEL